MIEFKTKSEIFTIGHSNHSLSDFLELLRTYSIQVIVDVRSIPYSRYIPQYNKEKIEAILRNHGFTYLFMGNCLGGKT